MNKLSLFKYSSIVVLVILFYFSIIVKKDFTLKEIMDFSNYTIFENEENQYPYLVKDEKNNLYGFMDIDGNFVIPPKYYSALNFNNGLACVNDGSKWLYIDVDDNVIIDNINGENITKINNFYDKIVPVSINNIEGDYMLNKEGDILLSPNNIPYFYWHTDVGQNLINVFSDYNYTQYIKTIDLNGNELVNIANPVYLVNKDGIGFYKTNNTDYGRLNAKTTYISDNYPPYDKGFGSFGVYDIHNNKKITSDLFQSISMFSDENIAVITLIYNGDVCIIDTNGNIVVNISEKLSLDNSKIINVKGIDNNQILIDYYSPQNDIIVDTSGNIICDSYNIVDVYHNDIAIITKNNKFGYIDLSGNIILEPEYSFVGRINNNKSLLVKDNKLYQFTLS